jgi:hypothetical protein
MTSLPGINRAKVSIYLCVITVLFAQKTFSTPVVAIVLTIAIVRRATLVITKFTFAKPVQLDALISSVLLDSHDPLFRLDASPPRWCRLGQRPA